MLYFTSDLHFYHDAILQYCSRPKHVFDLQIEKWNSIVTNEDQIYILGDFTLKGSSVAQEILTKLHGKKYLVKGNHDKFVKKAPPQHDHFVWVKDYHHFHHSFEDKNQMFVLSHYPFWVWNGQEEGAIHLHGHIHATKKYNEDNAKAGLLRFDVGVDANDYAPVSIETIMRWATVNPIQERPDYHYR